MFIVTAQLVKPLNRDDLPQMRGLDGLKNSSPLGVEPKGEGVTGKTGFSISSSVDEAPATAPKAVEPKTQEKKDSSTTSGDAVGTKSTRVNAQLPVRPISADLLVNAQPMP
jgi:hypothetical protein